MSVVKLNLYSYNITPLLYIFSDKKQEEVISISSREQIEDKWLIGYN
jgi:hypothetical protein